MNEDTFLYLSDDAPGPPGSVNALCVHPSLPLVVSAHENRQMRFLDTAQGTCLSSMVAHLEGVTSLAIDPQGIFLLSASKFHFCLSFNIPRLNKAKGFGLKRASMCSLFRSRFIDPPLGRGEPHLRAGVHQPPEEVRRIDPLCGLPPLASPHC